MPTYEYACQACGHELELFQSITASPKRKCPECGKLQLKRLIGTGAGIIFKGSGFYETDYRSESYKKAAKAEKDGGKSDGDGGKSADKAKTESSSSGSSDAAGSKSTGTKATGSKSDK
jgi:putative FmdB family regulatory protein